MSNASTDSNYSWARAFRDIGVHAINSGQFPFFCMFVIALVFLYRLPDETLSTISLEVLQNFKIYIKSGYALFAITLLLTTLYIKAFTKRHKDQLAKQNTIIEQLKNDLKGVGVSSTTTGESR